MALAPAKSRATGQIGPRPYADVVIRDAFDVVEQDDAIAQYVLARRRRASDRQARLQRQFVIARKTDTTATTTTTTTTTFPTRSTRSVGRYSGERK